MNDLLKALNLFDWGAFLIGALAVSVLWGWYTEHIEKKGKDSLARYHHIIGKITLEDKDINDFVKVKRIPGGRKNDFIISEKRWKPEDRMGA